MESSTNRIEREILLKAPRSRVWRALTNAEEFGDWFGVALKGKRFVAGEHTLGQVTHPGYEHLVFDVLVVTLDPERLFSFRWHHSEAPQVDYSKEPTTLVEFELKEADGGTLLRVVESGFDNLPPSRRLEAFRRNSGGWDFQMKSIEKHVATT